MGTRPHHLRFFLHPILVRWLSTKKRDWDFITNATPKKKAQGTQEVLQHPGPQEVAVPQPAAAHLPSQHEAQLKVRKLRYQGVGGQEHLCSVTFPSLPWQLFPQTSCKNGTRHMGGSCWNQLDVEVLRFLRQRFVVGPCVS